jgi:hypothetical protein
MIRIGMPDFHHHNPVPFQFELFAFQHIGGDQLFRKLSRPEPFPGVLYDVRGAERASIIWQKHGIDIIWCISHNIP